MSIIGKIYNTLTKIKNEKEDLKKYRGKNLDAVRYIKEIGNIPELTQENKATIDEYWSQYGIKFEDYSWFRLYNYVYGGQFTPRFIPNDIYAYIIWPYYNNKLFTHAADDTNFFQLAWRDKNYFDRLLPGVSFPKCYLRIINGRLYDQNYSIVHSEKTIFSEILNTTNEVIVKDAWDSGEGRGVKKYKISTVHDIYSILTDFKSDNFVIQEVIHQNSFFERFNKDSVNVIRVNTFNNNGEVVFLNATLRVGIKGSITDVCYVNGVENAKVIGISEDGVLADCMVNQKGEKMLIETVDRNSVSVPMWKDILDVAINGHKQLQHFDIVGWDFTVDKQNNVVCIEYNIQRPGTVFYQYVNGPFFGKYTEDALEFLRKPVYQNKYIPQWLKA